MVLLAHGLGVLGRRRQDERLMQIFTSINRMLSADVKCSQRRLQLTTYAVLPVSKRIGLLEWVQGTKPLKDYVELPKDMQSKAQAKYSSKEMHGCNGWDGYKKAWSGERAGERIDKLFASIVEEIPDDLAKRRLLAQQPSAHAQFLLRCESAEPVRALPACLPSTFNPQPATRIPQPSTLNSNHHLHLGIEDTAR